MTMAEFNALRTADDGLHRLVPGGFADVFARVMLRCKGLLDADDKLTDEGRAALAALEAEVA